MAIVITAQPQFDPPRNRIDITGMSGATVTVLRNDPDGRARTVRGAEPATLVSGGWVGLDYEAPHGYSVTYTAIPTVGTAQTSSAATLTTTQVWLIHPGVPALSVGLAYDRVESFGDRTRAARSGVLEPIGRSAPVVVSDVRSTTQSSVTIRAETLTQRDALWALLRVEAALLLSVPPAIGWGVTQEWISVGDVTETAPTRAITEDRVFTLPYTVVDRPVGQILSEWSYSGVLEDYTDRTYGDVYTDYASYGDVLSNTTI